MPKSEKTKRWKQKWNDVKLNILKKEWTLKEGEPENVKGVGRKSNGIQLQGKESQGKKTANEWNQCQWIKRKQDKKNEEKMDKIKPPSSLDDTKKKKSNIENAGKKSQKMKTIARIWNQKWTDVKMDMLKRC